MNTGLYILVLLSVMTGSSGSNLLSVSQTPIPGYFTNAEQCKASGAQYEKAFRDDAKPKLLGQNERPLDPSRFSSPATICIRVDLPLATSLHSN